MNTKTANLIIFCSMLCVSASTFAQDKVMVKTDSRSLNKYEEQIREGYDFFGLAAYYNEIGIYRVDATGVTKFEDGDVVFLESNQWLAQVARFKVAVWDINALKINQPVLLSKTSLAEMAPELDQLRYPQLWFPLAYLTKLVEKVLLSINMVFSSWGLTIVVFCLLVKLLLYPLSSLTSKLQRQVGRINQTLQPKLSEIKSSFDGEEAHAKIMAAHRDLKVTPFYSLKPLFSTLIQVPLLIAIFNALGEMPQINGSQFIWIENLSYPDQIMAFPYSIPLLGNGLNLLPILMTVVSLIATLGFTNNYDTKSSINVQKRNLYFMTLGFLILFYPFPAAMVLYWMTSNIAHLFQDKFFS